MKKFLSALSVSALLAAGAVLGAASAAHAAEIATPSQPTAVAGIETCVDGESQDANGTIILTSFVGGHWLEAAPGTFTDIAPGEYAFTAVADDGYELAPVDGLDESQWGLRFVVVPESVDVDCTNPSIDPCPSDFDATPMWEVTWGYSFAERNGGAPKFTMESNGGLIGIDDGPVPSYMTDYKTGVEWHWLYLDKPATDRVVKYSFADGTTRYAIVSASDGCPTITWTEVGPKPEPQVVEGAWSAWDSDCEAQLDERTREITTTDWVLNDALTAWVAGDPVVTTATETRAITDPSCDLPTLAVTGVGDSAAPGIAALLAILSGLAFVGYRAVALRTER